MSNELAHMPMKQLVKQDAIQQMLSRTLADKASQFSTSLINLVNGNQSLAKVDQMSVIQSAMVAATLNLPIDQNLGYMWLVPYKGRATPQIGYKGYIQLAQRTGQYLAMNAIAIHSGELKGWNPLTEDFQFDPMGRTSDEVIGYVGYFKLTNGFEKTVFWTKASMEEHRMNFSKMSAGKTPQGVWASNYDAMAIKTVLRNMLSKWGPMSIEMEQALANDETAPQTPLNVEAEESASETTNNMLDKFRQQQGEVNTSDQERNTEDQGDPRDQS
ncbi:recombinase RecT [Lactiplantibacillus plantarum]|uniref:recombinase RecT n=1 Tax=Lactiplantibacillus plantarum TaxID=1590 RepID=UPI000978C69A|nr:recombinase RecT [Lactiplantibacillus plantarum]